MIGALLRLGGAALGRVAKSTGRTAVNTGKATGRVAGKVAKGGALFGAGSMLGGASGAIQGGIGAVRSGTASGAIKAGIGGNVGVSPVTVPLPDLSNKKEEELLEIIAQNTDKTAKNTDLVNPPSAGGQALPPKDEDAIKESFFNSKQMKDFNKAITGISASTVGFGVAIAKLLAEVPKKKEEGDPETDKVSEAFEAVRPAAGLATAALALPAAKMATDKVGLTNRDPRGTVRDKKGTLRDAKTGKAVADPKSAAGQKRAAQAAAKKAATRSVATRAAMGVGKLALRAVPVLGAASLVAEGAYMGIDKLGYRDDIEEAGAKLIGGAVEGTKNLFGMDEESRNERTTQQLERRVSGFERESNPITRKLDPDRKDGYIAALKKHASEGNKEMFDTILKTMREEAKSGEQTANLDALSSNTTTAATAVPTPTSVAETVESEIDSYTDVTMAANKTAPIIAPPAPTSAPPAQNQDSIATTITVDRKAKDSLAEELKKINLVRMPMGF
jgi:translation elongation factor EF-1beta